MSSLLIHDIDILAGVHPTEKLMLRGAEMRDAGVINRAWLLLENGTISDFGTMDNFPDHLRENTLSWDASGRIVLPAWCDSHTHLVYAASREEEFVSKITGKTYEEIAAEGGGILNSARKLANSSEDQLLDSAFQRMMDSMKLGTGALEIKSGYGLSVAGELKMLRVIQKLKDLVPIPVRSTFLAAHAIPQEYKRHPDAYVDLIIDEMLPRVSDQGLADYIDVFCEKGFFTIDQTDKLLKAGFKYGLKPKIHANQLSAMGAVELGVKNNAVSVDHLEVLTEAAINCLGNSNTMGTLLPGCSLFLGIPFADARSLLNVQAAVAIASDHNPGSAPSGNMNLIVSLACMRLKMTPEEAINAATLNGAAAMEISRETGSIAKGKRANVIITKKIPSLAYIPYSFGENLIDTVVINGKIIN